MGMFLWMDGMKKSKPGPKAGPRLAVWEIIAAIVVIVEFLNPRATLLPRQRLCVFFGVKIRQVIRALPQPHKPHRRRIFLRRQRQ